MFDFSHYQFVTLDGLAGYVLKGGELYDELLLEAVELISPPLLRDDAMQALRREIDPTVLRGKGRPRKDEIRRSQLLELVKAQDRLDVPREILDCLIRRLESGKRFGEKELAARRGRIRYFENRDFLICAMYGGIYELLGTEPPHVHEVIGELDLGDIDPTTSRHDRALEATAKVIRDRFRLDPPSLRTMANIVAGRKLAKSV